MYTYGFAAGQVSDVAVLGQLASDFWKTAPEIRRELGLGKSRNHDVRLALNVLISNGHVEVRNRRHDKNERKQSSIDEFRLTEQGDKLLAATRSHSSGGEG